MAAEYSAISQIIEPNQPVIFQNVPCPCNSGSVYKKSGGIFLLLENAPQNSCRCNCGCRKLYETDYPVSFSGNITIPTGGTLGEIRLAIVQDGVIDPASIMSFTPPALETLGNVSTKVLIPVLNVCGCESMAVVNISDQPISLNNGSLVFGNSQTRRVN